MKQAKYISVEGEMDYSNSMGNQERLIGIFLYLEVPNKRWGSETKEILLTNTNPRELAKYVVKTIKKITGKNAPQKALSDIAFMVNRKTAQREEYNKRPTEDNTEITVPFLQQINQMETDDIAVKREIVEYNVWYN